MSEYPFGERRRVRYQDGAGNLKTVRARLLEPNPKRHPAAAVLLEISAPDGTDQGAFLALQSWQISEISPEGSVPTSAGLRS